MKRSKKIRLLLDVIAYELSPVFYELKLAIEAILIVLLCLSGFLIIIGTILIISATIFNVSLTELDLYVWIFSAMMGILMSSLTYIVARKGLLKFTLFIHRVKIRYTIKMEEDQE